MSTFPAVIDTDATLYVANDNIQTTLNVLQNPTDTVAIVASTTGWKTYMIATIDNEQQLVTGVVGANTLQVTRNFNGTGAASHTAGRKVSNFVDAAYHSAVSSAIQAIQKSLTGGTGSGWTQGPKFQTAETPTPKSVWSFNDVVQSIPLYSRYGQDGGPYITYPVAGGGDGNAEYHFYYHDAGVANVAALGKSFAVQAYKQAGSGGTLSGIWADVTANGTWTPQTAAGGITNGPIAGTFSASLNHSTGKGGFALSLNTYATCNGPSAATQISGIEVDVVNHVVGTDGHVGVMVVDQSTQPTTQAGADFAFGVIAGGPAPGFQYGLQMFPQGVASNGTLFRGQGSVQNGIDFSGMTFGGLVLNLPGFVLAPGGVIQSPVTFNVAPAQTALSVASAGILTGAMISLNHTTTNWSAGNALSMNFALGGGTFTGNFIALFNNSVLKLSVDSTGGISLPGLPGVNPGAGTKKLWYDPADGNRVKFAP